jgi:hypothetical protein
MEQPPPQPPTNDDLLIQAEQKLEWARNNYGGPHNDLANTAALVSLAASALAIARSIVEQTQMMAEVHLPEMGGEQG